MRQTLDLVGQAQAAVRAKTSLQLESFQFHNDSSWCKMSAMEFKTYLSIKDIPADDWDRLFASENPFTKHAFLLALENTQCVSADSGWQPRHLLMLLEGRPVAAMPMYLKSHSYGEFVFDWAWAEAYQRHGLNYYPKLVTAIPYTPVAGPRIAMQESLDAANTLSAFIGEVQRLAITEGVSSWHLLFADESLQSQFESNKDSAILRRQAVQFHWFNHQYQHFDDFLASLRSSRRKNLKRERRKLFEQGVTMKRLVGTNIGDVEWQAFYHCYQDTYLKRSGHSGYLNKAFFTQLREHMADQLMLVVALQQESVVGAALFLFDNDTLYGRYWGALQDVSYLHFEACFYQGIEFCIEQGLSKFDPGTQGEHKLIRGFEPVKSASYHWIADSRFRAAIEDFVDHEKDATEQYRQEAETLLPFKKADTDRT
jgi:predicted N-acyltransferase